MATTRFLMVMLLAALMGAVLVSCSPGKRTKTADGAEIVELWHAFNFEETAVFREIVDEFEKEWQAKTGEKIHVELSYVDYNNMFTKLKTAALANITPDMAFVDSIKVTDLAFGRALEPIDELDAFKKKYGTVDAARKEFIEASFNAGVVNVKGDVRLYGLPIQSTTVALFWNRGMFRSKAEALNKAGLDPNRAPQTWDEVIAYGKILTDAKSGIYGIGWHSSMWFNFPMFNMYDVDVVSYDEKGVAHASLNTPNGREMLATIMRIKESGVEGGAWKASALGPDVGFLNQKYAMAVIGPWVVENFKNAGIDFDIALMPRPNDKQIEELGLKAVAPEEEPRLGKMIYSSSNLGGHTGVLLRTCRNKELGFELMDYFTSEPVQRKWSSKLGQIPVRRSAWKDLDLSKYPYMTKFMDQIMLAKRIPQIPLYATLESNVFNPEFDLLLQGNQTPEEMMKKMEASLEKNILSKVNK